MSDHTWTILIATIGRRGRKLQHMLNWLLPQTNRHNGEVTVTALWNNGEKTLAQYRQELIESATSEYVSFIDDDDMISLTFVERVMEALSHRPDQVGWRMQCIQDGNELKPTFHSIRYNGWFEDENGYYRDVSHLNPVKRELALRCNFTRGEPPEDVSWVEQLRHHVKTEQYIDEIMYYYHASSADSTWRPGSVTRGNDERIVVHHPYFSFHPWSYSE